MLVNRLLDALPWRLRKIGLFHYVFSRSLTRARLGPEFSRFVKEHPRDDLTVAIAIKNRSGDRLSRFLKSIRGQNYDPSLVQVVVVDYDSLPEQAVDIAASCREFGAELIRIEGRPVWRKSHALNIAIKRCQTRFFLSTDVDNIFAPNFLREAVFRLKRHPFNVVLSVLYDLPEHCDYDANGFEGLKALAKPRLEGNHNLGTNLTYTLFYHFLGGYDERFIGWAPEDENLVVRLLAIGLGVTKIDDTSVFLHQWHPRYQGVGESFTMDDVRRNKRIVKEPLVVFPNRAGWGNENDFESEAPTVATRRVDSV